VTVGREADKVKPNGKKRMNLHGVAHPRTDRPVTRPPSAHLTGSLSATGFAVVAITRNGRLQGMRCY
jgi:hypothetical protein